MRRKVLLSLTLALSLMLFGAACARAQEVRVPVTGNPAFAFVLPPGWTSLIDTWGNLRLTRDNRTSVVQLSIMTGDDAHVSFPDLATGIFKNADAEPYSMSGPGIIAGISGQSFQSHITNPQGVKIDLLVVLARLDQEHVASLATMKPIGIGSGDISVLDDLVARVRLTGVK